MVQTKKTAVRDAILVAARELLQANGYHRASVAQIAARAGVSAANIYVYFDSKLDILFALYDPWLRARLERLETELQLVRQGEAQLHFIFKTIWQDIPAEENCFANNLMQALSTATPKDRYSRDLLLWAEHKVLALLKQALPPERQFLADGDGLAHIVLMSFDGFAMNQKLSGVSASGDEAVALMVTLLSGKRAC